MNIYIPTDEECASRINPSYVVPSIEEMMKGATQTNIGHPQFGADNGMYGKTISEEQKKIISIANSVPKPNLSKLYKKRFAEGNHSVPIMKGKDNPKAQPVYIDGSRYETLTEASKVTGIHRTTIAHRCKSSNKKYTEYRYAISVSEY